MDPIHSSSSPLPPQSIQVPTKSSPKEDIREVAISNSKAENLQGHINRAKLFSSDQAKKALPPENFFTRIIEFVKNKFKAIFRPEVKQSAIKSPAEKQKDFELRMKNLEKSIEDATAKYQKLNEELDLPSYDHPNQRTLDLARSEVEDLKKQLSDLIKNRNN